MIVMPMVTTNVNAVVGGKNNIVMMTERICFLCVQPVALTPFHGHLLADLNHGCRLCCCLSDPGSYDSCGC
jgi:hypothetical protein